MLFNVWTGAMHRPTRDLDLLGFGDPGAERLKAVFTALCDIEVPTDGLAFDADSVRVEAIREEQEYGGQRVRLDVSLGQARIDLQVDVGFGDAITPAAVTVSYPTLLESELPELRAYPKETVVAEKLEAMVKLGMANTRMKDFFDVLFLARTFPFDGTTLRDAITATFARRGTSVPEGTPVAFIDSFSQDEAKGRQWAAFAKRSGLQGSLPGLDVVVTELAVFLAEPLAAVSAGEPFGRSWQPGGPWRETDVGGQKDGL